MRLERLMHLQDYQSATRKRAGLHVLTNASFDGNSPEAVRLNLQSPNTGCIRAGSRSQAFPREAPPFRILSPSLLLSAEQLNHWASNFAAVYDAIGDQPLGNIRGDDPLNSVLLSNLQARSFEIAYIDNLLETLCVETDLYREYNNHDRASTFLQGNELTSDGRRVLDNFDAAIAVYSQIPELRRYSIQDGVRTGNLGPRGQRFREGFSRTRAVSLGNGCALEYVAYELKPLHLSGRDFCWHQETGDLRLVSVDLLCRYGGRPVWCEVKMAGDTWVSSAVRQLLFYGSMLSNGHQQRRFNRFFGDQFDDLRPWLSVLAEFRADTAFLADYEQSIEFIRHRATRDVLQPYFEGVIFALLHPDGEGFAAESRIVRW
jgi:hypothetical protein